MKYCDKCKVTVNGDGYLCPLCQNKLIDTNGESRWIFPEIPVKRNFLNMFIKFLIFGSVCGAVICVMINMLIPTGEFFWAGYVIWGLASLWVSTVIAIKNLNNIPKNILYQVIAIGVMSWFWDRFTGGYGWAINYVIPFMCAGAIITLIVLSITNTLNFEDILYYEFLYAIFGILPIVFMVTNLVTVAYPSVISIALSVISLVGMFVFRGKKILHELGYRFHV